MFKLLLTSFKICLTLALLTLSTQTFAQCNDDTTPPTCTAPAHVTTNCEAFQALGIDPNNTTDLQTHFGIATASDDCPVSVIELSPIIDINECGSGNITRKFKAVDQAGNESSLCIQTISIELGGDFQVFIPADLEPGDPIVDSMAITADMTCEIVAFNYEDLIYDYDCDGNGDFIERTFNVLDWCNVEINTPGQVLPRLDLDGDGIVGDAYTVDIRNDSVFIVLPNQTEQFHDLYNGILSYQQNIRETDIEESTRIVSGVVFNDLDSNCVYTMPENLLGNWSVEARGLISGRVYQTNTNDLGEYDFIMCSIDSSFEIRLVSPYNFGGPCPNSFTINVPESNASYTQDIPVHLEPDCPLLTVDISAAFLRRCFSSKYVVSYCNLSADTIEDAYIEVELDSFLSYESSSIPALLLSGNTYSFDVGDVSLGECNQFDIWVTVSCDAELGQTHCSTAHIFPDSLCGVVSPEWSGASIELSADCEGDSVLMQIQNAGLGNMDMESHYIVVEDVLMHSDGHVQLTSGSIEEIRVPANGATWFLMADQVANHPGQSAPMIAIEGCGGINEPGLATAFGENDSNPNISIDCQQNIGAYDPNDKRVSPSGYGDMHYTEANVDLEYYIRFQNTGTDTAFNIAIVDTLSEFLDPISVRPGASSHPYIFELLEGNVLGFSFDNIMLPDSNINEPMSHGFVKFKVSQLPDNPDDTRIENTAAIYFDFNEPIITNTTFNTIGREFIEEVVAIPQVFESGLEIKIMPHPVRQNAYFKLEGISFTTGTLIVHDLQGKALKRIDFDSDTFLFDKGNLSNGAYLYKIQLEEKVVATGTLILQ